MIKFLFWTILSLLVGFLLLYLAGVNAQEAGGFGSYFISALTLGSVVHLIVNGLGFHPTKLVAKTILPGGTYDKYIASGRANNGKAISF